MTDTIKITENVVSISALIRALKTLLPTSCSSHEYWTTQMAASVIAKQQELLIAYQDKFGSLDI